MLISLLCLSGFVYECMYACAPRASLMLLKFRQRQWVSCNWSCETPRGSWELNSGPLQECQVLLTTESPLQLLFMGLLNSNEFDRMTLKSRKKRLNIFSFEQFYLFLLIQAER